MISGWRNKAASMALTVMVLAMIRSNALEVGRAPLAADSHEYQPRARDHN